MKKRSSAKRRDKTPKEKQVERDLFLEALTRHISNAVKYEMVRLARISANTPLGVSHFFVEKSDRIRRVTREAIDELCRLNHVTEGVAGGITFLLASPSLNDWYCSVHEGMGRQRKTMKAFYACYKAIDSFLVSGYPDEEEIEERAIRYLNPEYHEALPEVLGWFNLDQLKEDLTEIFEGSR